MYFTTIDDATYAIKPMNCPGAMLVYKDDSTAIRSSIAASAEMGLCIVMSCRVLHGLMRVRCFTRMMPTFHASVPN